MNYKLQFSQDCSKANITMLPKIKAKQTKFAGLSFVLSHDWLDYEVLVKKVPVCFVCGENVVYDFKMNIIKW